MKRIYTTLTLISTFLFSATSVLAQTSDYQVKQNFQKQYESLETQIDEAMTVSTVDSLMEEVNKLAYRNENHEELLDHALYPNTFVSSIEDLKAHARNAEHMLLIIEDQDEKLAKLSKELTAYKNELASLNSATDSLKKEINATESSERNLSGLVKKYRKQLEERDKLVLNMIDSLFVTYNDVKKQSMEDLGLRVEPRTIQNGDNPLKLIRSVIDQHIQILKSDDGTLQTEDYLRMYVVQNRFSEVWDRIGSDLADQYGGQDDTAWKSEIETKLKDWKASASRNMWASMDEYMERNNVDLGAFDSNESFYNAIDKFISQATDSSKEKMITGENYEDFQAFYDFWNGKIKKDWGSFVQEGEVLTMNQISSIDSEMLNWRDHAKPRSFVIPILLGVSLLTIVGLIIVLARK